MTTPDHACAIRGFQAGRLWSLEEMIEFKVKPFIDIQDMLVQWSVLIHSDDPRLKNGVPANQKQEMIDHLTPLLEQLKVHEFDMCRLAGERFLETLGRTSSTFHIVSEVDDLRRRLLDQAKVTHCLSLSPRERDLYEPKDPLFGKDVEAKFPPMSGDIAESGKCLALGRSTAAVFHLMRVMEIGVQRLGAELGVTLVGEKNWQNILDEVNKAIRALDHKLSRTKALAEASSHLYAVKVAWRNEVMHPKQTYTPDEADAIFRNVRVFTQDLVGLL